MQNGLGVKERPCPRARVEFRTVRESFWQPVKLRLFLVLRLVKVLIQWREPADYRLLIAPFSPSRNFHYHPLLRNTQFQNEKQRRHRFCDKGKDRPRPYCDSNRQGHILGLTIPRRERKETQNSWRKR